MESIKVRNAKESDSAALLFIYSHYVKNSAVTFEYDVPPLEEFSARVRNTIKNYPYLVAETNDEILGYAYAGAFHSRAAYAWSAEVSIYVRNERRGLGAGKALYKELEKKLSEKNILNLYACAAFTENPDKYLTNASIFFHERMGYKICGRFNKCGYKFDRWYDMVWLEKHIGKHTIHPKDIK